MLLPGSEQRAMMCQKSHLSTACDVPKIQVSKSVYNHETCLHLQFLLIKVFYTVVTRFSEMKKGDVSSLVVNISLKCPMLLSMK